MESNICHGALAKQPTTIVESDDVCDSAQCSFSGQYDSGICSITDCLSFRSGGASIGSIPRNLDGTTNLEEKLKGLRIWEAIQVEKSQGCGAESVQQDWSSFGPGYGTAAVTSVPVPVSVPGSQAIPTGESTDRTVYNPISRAIDPFDQDEDGDTQLHLAIIQPNPSMAIRLIEAGQFSDRLDIQNDHQQTPLHLAVITDQPQVVRALVLSGASLMARDRQGNVPLHMACKLGHVQCVEQLTTPASEEEQHYIWAERLKKGLPPKMMSYMLPQDISLLNYEGDTCLHLALSSVPETKIYILNYLLNARGADINAPEGKCGFTLLHQAVRSRDLEAVQFLLMQANIDVNERCYNGYAPLDFAISQHQDQLASLLRQRGAVSFIAGANMEAEVCQDDVFDDLVVAGAHAQSLRR